MSPEFLPIIGLVGCAYILYLAIGILRSHINTGDEVRDKVLKLKFRDGFIVQVFNPKAMLALVPITTVQLPAAGVTGIGIFFTACAIGILAMWAPGSYSYIGEISRHKMNIKKYLNVINKFTGVLLIFAAVAMFYGSVYLPIMRNVGH